ncbi:leucine-rich repeat protein [Blautia sp.]|uniref:leucine-rich repeat protein n=2 Tax=Blautia TaxID=572511 RepID=UPI003AB30F57
MKKKLLACTLAVLMCLQPASAVLAEDPKPGDVAQTSEKVSISSYSDLSDTAVSDDASSTDEDSSAVSDFSASDTSETISNADSADSNVDSADSGDSDLSEEDSVQELTEDFSDDVEDTEALTQEESADEASAQEPEFDDGSVPSAGADSNTFGDFQYTTSGLTATITKYTGTAASVTVPSKIDNYTVTKIASSAFANNLPLTSVVISDTITEIGSNAFEGCAALESIKLPSKLKTLGYDFISGTLVTTLTIPAGLTTCVSSTYYYGPLNGAENLTELILADGMEKIPAYLAWFSASETTHLTTVSIPDSVTSIGSYSFANCTALGEITIPDSVTSIASYAFSGCSRLSSVRWSENLQSIGSGSFSNCTALETLSFPKSVKTIDSGAFKGCSSVSSLSFSDNPKGGFLTDIEYSAFENCTALENISFSQNINSLGSSAFSGCSSLEKVILSDSITTIDSYAFSGCSALESIKLPSKLKTLGYDFISGTLVTTLTIPAGLTKCDSSTYYYGPLNGAENLTELILADGMEKIPAYLAWFSASETTHLTSVSIPDSVTSIGSCSFANCTALGEITIPDSVTSIANNAFSGWKNLVIKSTAGSAAHAYAKTNNIPFQEVIQEGKRIIAGRLDAVNAEDGTINIEGRDYPVSGNFSLTSAMSILQNSSDKIVVFNYDNSRVTHMEAAEDIVTLQMQAITDVNNSNTFVYENGQYQKTSLSQNMVLKCKVSQNSSYSYDEIRQLLPGYTISVTGIELLASAPLNAHFREALALSKMEFSTPVKVKVTDSKNIATAVFGISSDYIAEKANSDFSVSFLARYGNSDSYVLSGGKHIYLANHDYQRQQTEKKKSQTERGQKLASAQQILGKNNSILTIDPKLNDYFTKPQMEEFYDFLSCYMAVAINSTSFSYTGDQKNKSCQQVLEKLFEKMGITKQSFIVGKTLKGHFAISASTQKGDRTINFTYSVSAYGFSDVNFSSLGTLNYSISQDNCSGIIGLAGADTKAFAEQVKQLAEASVKNVYNEAWGNYANEVADLLFTKTVQDLIRNSRYGSFSNLVYTMLTKPSQTAAAQNRRKTNTSIKCPVDVYVYDSSHNLCGSIINNVVDTSYNDIIMSVENDEKFISFCGDDYYLKLVGNDNGTMTYEIEEYNGDTLSRKITYNDIPLTAGKKYNAYIPEGQDMDTGVYSPINESGEKSQAASDTRKTAPQPVSVESIQLDQTQKALLTGESFKLTPSIKPANASTKDVLWSSDKESVATVDDHGTVKALSAGTAVITATTFDGALTATCAVTVTSPEVSVDTLTVTVPDVDCNGQEQRPQVTVKNGDTLLTQNQDYTLSYSNNTLPGTATVTITGLGSYTGKLSVTFRILEKSHKWSSWKVTTAATVLKTGKKQRTCSYCKKKATASIARLKPTLKLSMTSVILKKGQTTTAFKVTGLAKGDKVKSYRSSNTKIASIDSRGKIKGIRIGSTKITVTLASGKKATVTVKVQKNAVTTQKLTVSPSRISLKLKKTYKLKISRSPLTTVERITYRSSNSKVASVNSKGVITARKKGTATITVLSGKKKATVKITVK